MFLNENKLELLTSNQFIIDCIQIKLIQQKENDPFVYQGSGSIYQLSDGNFHLKLYHHLSSPLREPIYNQDNHVPGEIISKEYYYRMEAHDMTGDIWESYDISVQGGFSVPAIGRVINTKISMLSIKQDRPHANDESSNLYLVSPGKYQIPYNSTEKFQDGGWIRNICRVEILGINLEIRDRKTYITISAKDPSGGMNDSFHGKLKEALSIVFGKPIPILLSSFSSGDTNTIVLSSIQNSILKERSLESPIKHTESNDTLHFKEFVEKYIQFFDTENEPFYGYWHKVNRSWQGSLEITALAICTAIEGITKNYYSDFNCPGEEIIKQAEETKKFIKSTTIDSKIKCRLLQSISHIVAPNPKNALYKLVEDNKLDKKLVDCWKTLRNKSAHADNLKEGKEETQKYLDDVFTCLSLFYLLLLLRIGFKGSYQDYSKKGWGETFLTQDLETIEDSNSCKT